MVVDRCREKMKKQSMFEKYSEVSKKLHVEGWKKNR